MKLLNTMNEAIAARKAKMISTTADTSRKVISTTASAAKHVAYRIRRFVIRTLLVVGTIILVAFAMLITIGIVFPPSPASIARMEDARADRAERREDTKRVRVGGHKRGGAVQVDGYWGKDGTYVKPYTRSAPTN